MDVHPPSSIKPMDDHLAALSSAADAMEQAAWVEGIGRDDALGLWVRSMRHALVALATMVHGEGATVAGILDRTRKTAEAELKAAHAANETARIILAQARGVSSALEQQSRASEVRTFEHLVEKLRDSLTATLRNAVLIRERRHNRIMLSWFGAVVAMAAFGLVISGYAWCAYEDRAATSLLSRCIEHNVENTVTHQAYCQLSE